MPPPRYRDLSKGSVLEATYTDALEDLLSGYESRPLNVVISSPTSIQVVAGGSVGSVGASVNGEWRHIEASQTRSHPGGAAGTYDVYLVASANAFAVGPPDVGELDNTFYGFELRIVPGGAAAPTGTLTGGQVIANTRKVRTLQWDGAAITRIDRLSPESPALHASSHAPGGSDPMLVDAAVGTGSLRTLGAGPLQAVAGDDPRLNNSRAPTGPAGGDLSNAYPNPTIKADVGLTGAPTAPTPAQDSGGTRIATAGFVLGQASNAAPAMNDVAAAGVVSRWARGDHVHPTDTSRAPLASPVFTTRVTAPLVELTAQAPTLLFTGDIDGAKWATRLGNTSLTFLSDNAAAQTLGTGDVVTGGRTYKPKVTFDPSGNVITTGSFSGASLQVPSILGTPNFAGAATGQTAAPGDNTTKLATTAFVLANGTQLGSSAPLMDGAATVGVASTAAHADHRHPTDTSRAPTASPTFTGTVTANADIYARGTLVRLSDGPSGRGYVEVGGDGLTYMHSTAAGTLALQGSAIRHDAGSLGFFGNAPVGRQAYTGSTSAASRSLGASSTTDLNNVASVLRQLLIDLAALGLITWN